MDFTKAIEHILLILIAMLAAMFAFISITISIVKKAINDMMNFKGDNKDE